MSCSDVDDRSLVRACTSATRVKVGRQVHWITVIHCSVGDFEEDTLWNTKTVTTGEHVW